MTTETRRAIQALDEGKAHTEAEPDWGLVQELIGVDLEEYDCDYDYYITERIHPLTFIRGDVAIDGHTSSHAIVEGREGYVPPTEYKDKGVVILGDLRVSGGLQLDELTPLFVAGDVTAGVIQNDYGTLVVGGSIETQLIYCASADEGGQIHSDDCSTKLFIDASGTLQYHCDGDFPLLLANGYSPRAKYTLQRALEELGFSDFGTTVSAEISAVIEAGEERVARLIALIESLRDARPPNLPEAAEWSENYPCGYRLQETDDEGQPHGLDGYWKADGRVVHLKRFKHGVPHGAWLTEHGNRLQPRLFSEGKLVPPAGVPEGAVWKDEDWEWELAPRDEDGAMHGLVRWWRPDGTLVCETPHVHGSAEGEGTRFHESGEVSQTFTFVDGQLHGERTWYSTESDSSELATKGLPKNVARVVRVYDNGAPVGEARLFDADGQEVDGAGQPVGAR